MEIALKSEKIFIANQPVDFRRSIDGLCLLVANMQQDPSHGIYIFYNKHMNRVKVLGWNRNGFAMIYKRLESGKFFVRTDGNNLQINSEQLNWLLIGVDWQLMSGGKCQINSYF